MGGRADSTVRDGSGLSDRWSIALVFSPGSLFRWGNSAGPKGYRAYAIGDVHGRLDLLDELLLLIEADIASRSPAKNLIVFLGDLIDRGPRSAQVVERLRLYKPSFAKVICLMGNHEEAMLRVVGGEGDLLRDWLRFGGAECVESYGLDPRQLGRADPSAAVAALNKAVPKEHIAFLHGFADTASFGSYLFVHAGIRPKVRLEDQRSIDLRWIRSPFLEDRSEHGFTVVHGHTISEEVDFQSNRIGIDTGAYKSGLLTALGIERRQHWLLQVAGASRAGAVGSEGGGKLQN